jgi:PAS domain S-box-containing protein
MKPLVAFLRIIAVIALAELVTMTVLSHLGMKGGAYVLVDTTLLVLLSAPFIHLWVVNGAVRSSSFEALLTKATLQQEEAMREKAETSARHLSDLVNQLDAIVYEADRATGKFTFVSERARILLGYPAERWLSEQGFWASLLHPADRDRVVEQRRAAVAAERDYRLEYRMVASDGREVKVRDSLVVAPEKEGKTPQLRGVMVEMTGYAVPER